MFHRCLPCLLFFSLASSAGSAASINVDPWYGRAIYFIVVDRFALDIDDYAKQCGVVADGSAMSWCGGTLKGIHRKLDYIQGMGFDAIWITPVVKQVPWKDKYNGTGYHGYWAQNFMQIDPRFGTEADLLLLSRACKDRGMLFMLDVVANHVGPIHSINQVEQLGAPLNAPSGNQFHQLGKRPDETFEEYLQHPVPAYVNIPDVFTGRVKYSCWTGNYSCFPEYSENQILNGWFGDLGDLNQNDPTVRAYLLDWIEFMVKRYELDGIRLDTAAYIPMSFLEEFQQRAGVFVIGEVVTYNMTYHSSFQKPLRGVLNFPIALQWTPFPDNEMSNDVWRSVGSFDGFNRLLHQQMEHNYTDLHLLGNFVDNHDTMRFSYSHSGDTTMLENALTLVFMIHGIPIYYYGTENLGVSRFQEERRSMWMPRPVFSGDPEPYGRTALYTFTRRLNDLRRYYGFSHGGQHVKETVNVILAARHMLAFTRGDVLIVVTDGGVGTSPETCFDREVLPDQINYGCIGRGVHDVLRGDEFVQGARAECTASGLCIKMDRSHPAIFAARENLPEGRKSLFSFAVGIGIFFSTVLWYFWKTRTNVQSIIPDEHGARRPLSADS